MNKDFIKEKWPEWKPKVIVLVCLTAAFISGVITGKLNGAPPVRRQLNYTTTNVNKPLEKSPGNINSLNTNKSKGQGSDCPIKGNIGSGSKKTYHVRGGAFYERTQAELCFTTETEALQAGFVKSTR